jgi:hypothetical protein
MKAVRKSRSREEKKVTGGAIFNKYSGSKPFQFISPKLQLG